MQMDGTRASKAVVLVYFLRSEKTTWRRHDSLTRAVTHTTLALAKPAAECFVFRFPTSRRRHAIGRNFSQTGETKGRAILQR